MITLARQPAAELSSRVERVTGVVTAPSAWESDSGGAPRERGLQLTLGFRLKSGLSLRLGVKPGLGLSLSVNLGLGFCPRVSGGASDGNRTHDQLGKLTWLPGRAVPMRFSTAV